MNRKNIYYWLLLPVLALMMGACSESNDNEEPDNPDTHVTPIDPGDWQTVPAAGGTIEKGDIALTFPTGTFDSDTKVAITEVEKGKMYGDFEASTFYQLTMPAKIDQPIAIKIKGKVESNGIYCLAIGQGMKKSLAEETTHSVCVEGSYEQGEFSFVLPATKNDEDDGNSTVTYGLIDVPDEIDINSSTTRSARFLVIQGKVGNIEWYYDMDYIDMYKAGFSKVNTIKSNLNKYNTYIIDALQKINDLGFKVETNRKIPIKFINGDDPNSFGAFVQDQNYDERNSIEINMNKIFSGVTDKEIAQTFIHELLHYYQSDYDPRSPSKKSNSAEDNVICEAASVWIEQFMDNGKLNGSFIEQYLPGFVKTLDMVDEVSSNDVNRLIHPYDWRREEIKRYASHGYAMSTLLYYLTNPMSEMEAFEIDKNSIVEIFKLWKTDKPNYRYAGRSFLPFERWLMNHDCGFMLTDEYDDYLLKLFTGKIIDSKYINLDNLGGDVPQDAFKNKEKIEFSGECLSHGCKICKFSIVLRRPLKGKEIVIKQNEPDVRTYALVQKKDGCNILDGKAVAGDSIVISGDEMDSTYPDVLYIYLATINSNYTKQIFNIVCELRDTKATITPSEMTFPAEGGTQEAKITASGFSYFGASVDNAYSSWLSATPAKGGKVTVTAKANTTSEKRMGYVKCYVAKSADAPESEWVWLTPIKVTQEAKTVKEEWVLVKTEAIAHEDTSGDRGQYMHYSASATELSKKGKVLGAVGPYRDIYELFDLGFVATIQAPPDTLNAGETLRLHITVERTTAATIDKSYNNQVACYSYPGISMWWNIANSSGYFSVENLDGPKGGPSSYSTEKTSSWDYVYRVPSGSKGKEESIYLQGCDSKVIWTYRWYTPSD